ncbi:MAG: hypothetical protein WB994_22860 [Candidatus Acidiferrum sp.]
MKKVVDNVVNWIDCWITTVNVKLVQNRLSSYQVRAHYNARSGIAGPKGTGCVSLSEMKTEGLRSSTILGTTRMIKWIIVKKWIPPLTWFLISLVNEGSLDVVCVFRNHQGFVRLVVGRAMKDVLNLLGQLVLDLLILCGIVGRQSERIGEIRRSVARITV